MNASAVACSATTDDAPANTSIGRSRIPDRLTWLQADCAPERELHDQQREQDGAQERDQQVERREGEAEVDPHDLEQQPAEESREAVADRDADYPAGERDGEPLGGEDAADVAT